MKMAELLSKRRYVIAFASLVVMAGAGTYLYLQHREQKRLEAGIFTLTCSYQLALGGKVTEMKECLERSERKARIFSQLESSEQKIEFLTNLCRNGSKSMVTKDDCEAAAWNVMYNK